MRPLSMKRLFFCLLALSLVVTACNQASTARISATIEGAPNTAIVLEKLNYNRLQTIDTIRTDGAGQFNYKVRLKGNEPYFYYLYREGSPIASLILLPSDQVTVVVPQEGRFTVEGSEESTLFQEVNEAYARASDQIRNLTASITDETPEAKVKEVNQQLSKLYVDYKRSAIRHMVTHPHSITSAVMAFQKFGDDLPVFGQESDFVILQAVRDSLSSVYPKSEFLTALRDEVDSRARNMELSSRLGDVVVINFPELMLPDMEGQTRRLSELDGKVIVGTRAHKQRTMSFNAFNSVNFPLPAIIRAGRIVRDGGVGMALGDIWPDGSGDVAAAAGPLVYDQLNERVIVLRLTPGLSPRVFDLLAGDFDAIVLETFGIGGIPEYERASFERAIFGWVESGHTLALTTQVSEEGLDLGVYEVGRAYAENADILKGDDMTTEALVAKTMWALGQSKDPEVVRELFYRTVNHDRNPR